MRLTSRDVKIIEYIDKFQGGTIEQIQLLYFTSYDMCKKRLKILKDNIVDFRKEYVIDKFKVDALLVTKHKKVIVVEVDIFNRTSEDKIKKVKKGLKEKLGIDEAVVVVAKEGRRKKGDWTEIKLDEIEKIKEVV